MYALVFAVQTDGLQYTTLHALKCILPLLLAYTPARTLWSVIELFVPRLTAG